MICWVVLKKIKKKYKKIKKKNKNFYYEKNFGKNFPVLGTTRFYTQPPPPPPTNPPTTQNERFSK